MILEIILYAFIAYVVYKVVFELIVPVYITTRKLKKGFREMHSRMNDYATGQQDKPNSSSNTRSTGRQADDDYIDFEEIK